jgi:hypothetical protein
MEKYIYTVWSYVEDKKFLKLVDYYEVLYLAKAAVEELKDEQRINEDVMEKYRYQIVRYKLDKVYK